MRPPQRSHRRVVAPVLVAMQAIFLASCEPAQTLLVQPPTSSVGIDKNEPLNNFHVREVTLTAPDSSIAVGERVQATAVPLNNHGDPLPQMSVQWSITPASVATISSAGLITGVAAGTATVSATAIADRITRTMTITVEAAATDGATTDTTGTTDGATNGGAADSAVATPSGAAVHMISISINASTLKVGETTQISGVVRDVNGTPIAGVPVTWSASPTTVATVTSTAATTGLVTARGAGTAIVYAKADTTVRSIVVTVTDSTASAPAGPVPAGASGGSYGSATAAELPRLSVNTAYPAPSRQVRVPAGADLQAAIDAAQPGDELLLAPGASYVGNFLLPDKGATGNWITIRTDLSDGAIGAPGTRMTPSRAASANLARILSPNIYSTLTTTLTAHHYRFTGVEIGATSAANNINAIVRFGDDTRQQNSAATTANNLVLDRTYIHGSPTMSVRRCLMLNSASTALVDSWLGDCHTNDGDSQAIVGWNGPGPYLIQNNHLEAGHEVILLGGGTVTAPNVSPSDITIRGNHIMRPVSWKGVWQAKNLIETKHARRLLIEGNVIENSWQDAQVGFAFVMKSENQNNDTPWTQSTDITIRFNRIRNVGGGFNIAANPSGNTAVPAARFVITDNVMENVGVPPFGGDGRSFQLLGGLTDIVAMHNTIVSASGTNPSAITFAELPTIQRLAVHSNVLVRGAYGVKGGGVGEGTASLDQYASGWLYTNNAMAYGGIPSSYPANNYFPATLESIGFVDLLGGNYRLSAGSAYLGKGYDGRDIGADMNQLEALTRNAVVAP